MSAAHVQERLYLFLSGLSVIHHQNKILSTDSKHLHKSGCRGQLVSVHTHTQSLRELQGDSSSQAFTATAGDVFVRARVKALYLHRVAASVYHLEIIPSLTEMV